MSGTKRSLRRRSESPCKRRKVVLDLDTKMDIIDLLENGEKPRDIAYYFDLSIHTILTIGANRDFIKQTARKASQPTAKRSSNQCRIPLMDRMETLLVLWIEDSYTKRIPIDSSAVCQKARDIFNHLKKQEVDPIEPDFSASIGWFDRFCEQNNIFEKLQIKPIHPDTERADTFMDEFEGIVQGGCYTARQIFNADEIGLYWKRLPSRTYLSKEEKCSSGRKVSRDRLNLLLCGNAFGDFKCKPFLVYKSENPPAFEHFHKEELPVHWRSNKKACMTSDLFKDWFTNCFCPEVKEYCREREMKFRVLLVLDNTYNRVHELDTDNQNVKIVYLPPNTAALLQPMNQGITENFKRLFLRQTFESLLQAENEDKPNLREFWREYNIVDAIENIYTSWEAIQPITMNCVWKPLWPTLFYEFDETVDDCTIEELYNLGRRIGGDGFEGLGESDVNEVLESHDAELTPQELQELEEDIEMTAKDDNANSTSSKLSEQSLENLMSVVHKAVSIVNSIDPNVNRSSACAAALLESVEPYQALLMQKQSNGWHPHKVQLSTSTQSAPDDDDDD